jgi:uncharacterized membrane protein SpoIIM required for sporulation
LFVSIIFICAIVIGYNGVLSDVFSVPLEWIEELSEGIKDFTEEYPAWLVFFAFLFVIFLNNAFTCFLCAVLVPRIGINILVLLMEIFKVTKTLKLKSFKDLVIIISITLGLLIIILVLPLLGMFMCGFPIFSAFLNGGLIGWFAHEEGLMVFLLIAPHGVVEIPAFLLSVAIGLKQVREFFKEEGERNLEKELGDGLRVYLILILPLLLIAALIESGLIVAALFLI